MLQSVQTILYASMRINEKILSKEKTWMCVCVSMCLRECKRVTKWAVTLFTCTFFSFYFWIITAVMHTVPLTSSYVSVRHCFSKLRSTSFICVYHKAFLTEINTFIEPKFSCARGTMILGTKAFYRTNLNSA